MREGLECRISISVLIEDCNTTSAWIYNYTIWCLTLLYYNRAIQQSITIQWCYTPVWNRAPSRQY